MAASEVQCGNVVGLSGLALLGDGVFVWETRCALIQGNSHSIFRVGEQTL